MEYNISYYISIHKYSKGVLISALMTFDKESQVIVKWIFMSIFLW